MKISIVETLKKNKNNKLEKVNGNKLAYVAANIMINKSEESEESIIKDIKRLKEEQLLFQFKNTEKYEHIPFIFMVEKGYSRKNEETYVCLARIEKEKSHKELAEEYF